MNFRKFVKATYYKIDSHLMKVCVRHPILSAIYYLCFNKGFFREHQSVIAGKLAYYASFNQVDVVTSPLLRRNIHRIEKGLIMRPMRSSFGADYILETVDEYIRVVLLSDFSVEERLWARDVLQSYFSSVQLIGEISKAKDRLEKIGFFENSNVDDNTSKGRCPYPRSDVIKSTIEHDDFRQLCIQRRSVRWFKENSTSESKVRKAIDTASLSPSACNRQPYRFDYFEGNDAQEIASLAMGTKGFLKNIPALIVLIGDLSAYPFERDRHVIYIDASLAAMSFMLALETLGLSSCPINWPDIENREQKMTDRLNLFQHERPIMLIAVGEALETGGIPFSQKNSSNILMKRA